MNKKLLLILLAGLILVAGFTFVYAKHINKEATQTTVKAFRGAPRAVEEPAVPVVERMRTGTLTEKPKSLEDLKAAMLQAGKSYIPVEDQMKADLDVQVEKMVTPTGIIDEWSLTECVIFVHNDPCCYWQPWPDYFDAYMNCVVTAEYWEYQDAQNDPEASACGYPVYPFEVSQVQFFIGTPAPCSIEAEFAVTWDYGSIYWGFPFPYYPAPDWSSGILTFWLDEAGSYMVTAVIPEEERPCYHVPFFARFWLMNSDDFREGPDAHRCGPDTVWGHEVCVEPVIPGDPDSCQIDDTTWGHWECVEPTIPEEDSCVVYLPSRYAFWITGVYDGSAIRNQGYYYNDLIGGYYDIVDIKGGSMRLYAGGFTRDQNDCELESLWYHKAAYFDTTDEGVIIAYAPDGMPDFPQVEPHFCGPAALTNCLWWCFAGGFPWYTITNWYGAWDPSIPPIMMNELAGYALTDAYGTDVYDLQAVIDTLNDKYGFWLMETTIVQPTFDDIEYQIRLSQDVILLLGFWYYDESAGEWFRLGGHYVTCSGVNWEFYLLSFSDPFLDGVCSGLTPGDSSSGVFLPHDHVANPACHFDAGNVSHDYYQIAFDSPSPGGILWIPYYEWYDVLFYKMNFTPELEPYMSTTGTPAYPVVTEIEYAVVICPGDPFVFDDKDSWNMFMTTSNFGSLGGPDVYTWQYYPDFVNDGFEGTVICGTNPDDLALSITQAGEDIKWFPTTPLDVTYYYYDEIDIEQLSAHYYHNHPSNQLPLDVDYLGIGLDPFEGSLAGHPLGDMVIQKYVVHATGTIDTLIEWAIWFDLDVNYENYTSENPSFGGGDMATNTMWAYDSTREDKTVYITLAPTHEGQIPRNMMIMDQNTHIYDHVPCGPYDTLKAYMESEGPWFPTVMAQNHDWYDYSYLMTSEPFILDSCERILQEYLIWYDWQIPSTDYTAYRCKLYRLLRGAGFYRGDVGNFATGAASPGVLDIADIVFIVSWLWRAGPDPEPFIDQGDVDCDGETKVEDVVYLVGYILRASGRPPIDKDRFFNEYSPWPEYQMLFSRPSLFADPQWMNLGVGCPIGP